MLKCTNNQELVEKERFFKRCPGWEDVYSNPNFWHFRFNGPIPEALVEWRISAAYFWNDLAAGSSHFVQTVDRESYVPAYGRTGRMRAVWARVSFAKIPRGLNPFPISAIPKPGNQEPDLNEITL